MVNTVFEEYYGKEEEFEKIFGFPMYTISSNGNIDYNYEYLILDFFCWTYKDDGYTIEEMYGNVAEGVTEDDGLYTERIDEFTGKADGSDTWTYESFEEYLKENYGVESKVTTTGLHDQYKQSESSIYWKTYIGDFKSNSDIIKYYNENKTESNYITIACSGFSLYSDEGKLYYFGDASEGHAMEIVDITEEGDIIVSSWGMKFKLNIDAICYESYIDDAGVRVIEEDWCYLVINEY